MPARNARPIGVDLAKGSYQRHRPEETVLYTILQAHWRSFLAETEAEDGSGCGLPRFVVDEVEAFLRCGILAHGFIRVVCDDCRQSRVVPFACKRRGFCPSCLGRRMCDFAGHLRERVMPHVPVRQWVLTVPFGLRFGMAFNPALTGVVLRAFVGIVSRWLRRRARARRIRGVLKTGGVTVIQRFGSALNLNVHFHTLMIDGVYEIAPSGAALFHPVPAPTDEDVAAVVEQVYRKVAGILDAQGDDDGAALASTEPGLATLAGASVAGVGASGPRRGARTLRLGSSNAFEATVSGRKCASVEGFSLHANVRVAANDRDGLEHLARYLARPPVATERLTQLADGRVALRFKRPFSDGTQAVVFTPFEFIERLLPLIPRPGKHTIRFHGILAPAAGYRAKVVPAAKAPAPTRQAPGPEPPARYRLPWAELLRRVFLVDALDCPRCHGRMRIVAAVTESNAAERILRHLGEHSAPPPVAGPRAPPSQDQAAVE
jgi:putative transposase/transposase-like zinc-binding protein